MPRKNSQDVFMEKIWEAITSALNKKSVSVMEIIGMLETAKSELISEMLSDHEPDENSAYPQDDEAVPDVKRKDIEHAVAAYIG